MSEEFYRMDTLATDRSIGYLLRIADILMVERIGECFSGDEITFSQWVALSCLEQELVHTAADIARLLRQDTGSVTRMVDQLETHGLLKRVRATIDRRIVNLHLTARGRNAVRRNTASVTGFLNHALAEFSATEVQTLIGLLSRLIDRLERTGD